MVIDKFSLKKLMKICKIVILHINIIISFYTFEIHLNWDQNDTLHYSFEIFLNKDVLKSVFWPRFCRVENKMCQFVI